MYLLQVISPNAPKAGKIADLLRSVLGRLAQLYDFGLEVYLFAEKLGIRRREKLPIPTISVGNLSVGGTGKTPMTQMLCQRLSEQNIQVALLSRGHGGQSHSVRIVSDGDGKVLLTAAEAGDEPVQTAQALPGIPVLVGKDRRASGREAMRRFGLDALILDDGFQYWQLARDLDIILLDSRLPFDNGYPLPRGLLREPARHLKRARIAVVTRADRLNELGRTRVGEQIRALAPKIEIFYASHRAIGLIDLKKPSSELLPLETLGNQSIVALSAIAQPQSFFETLQSATGANVCRHLIWSDHHRFAAHEVEAALVLTETLGAATLVMTEKDAAKWPLDTTQQGNIALYALRIEMGVENEQAFLTSVMRSVSRK